MKATDAAPNPKNVPSAPSGRKCSWCGQTFHSSHPTKEFCEPAHKQAFANWCASRGKVLFPIAMAWRTQRGRKGTGADAMAEMVRFLDACAAELTAQGAPPIAQHYSSTRKTGTGVTHWNDYDRRRPSRQPLAPSGQAEE